MSMAMDEGPVDTMPNRSPSWMSSFSIFLKRSRMRRVRRDEDPFRFPVRGILDRRILDRRILDRRGLREQRGTPANESYRNEELAHDVIIPFEGPNLTAAPPAAASMAPDDPAQALE